MQLESLSCVLHLPTVAGRILSAWMGSYGYFTRRGDVPLRNNTINAHPIRTPGGLPLRSISDGERLRRRVGCGNELLLTQGQSGRFDSYGGSVRRCGQLTSGPFSAPLAQRLCRLQDLGRELFF